MTISETSEWMKVTAERYAVEAEVSALRAARKQADCDHAIDPETAVCEKCDYRANGEDPS